ncbi:ABC transporter ATP-binding protein [Tardiphaga robiniae]|uniref:ABC transporter ATP-binding protein n=1 Tax=Tardiphaga robiniae TaxID=943830 RepID=A0A7G6TXC6_9BRAD|nr:ABC transporter ATP-binding protein [Tardiphaga robiniae]QND71408.1 ABC transporter ATP-binding protein [Tardiphaga robiniae]
MTEFTGLAIRHVTKTYVVDETPLPVLQDVSLSVLPGEFVSIVGASGCGKSTLLRLIVGLDDVYRGEILLGGTQVSGPGADRGIVFQDHRLFPWLTLTENVALALDAFPLPAEEKARRVRDSIALVGLSGFERARPAQLSGGMAQRAAIARALVRRPAILLLDEPLGALDSLNRMRLQDALLDIWEAQRTTVIMVTHDVEEAVYLSTRIVVMEPRPGRIRSVIPVELAARDRAAPDFVALKQRVLADLRH